MGRGGSRSPGSYFSGKKGPKAQRVNTSSNLGLSLVLTIYFRSLKDRILAAGYDSADIDSIGMSAVPGANADKVLTEKGLSCIIFVEGPADVSPTGWRYIRAKVESKLSSAREKRLQERCQREMGYKTKAEQCYSDVLRQVLPVQRLYLPALSQACELSCFRELLNPDRIVLPSEWVHAAGHLLESLSEWMSLHRDKYTSLLPYDSLGVQHEPMKVKLLSDPSVKVWRQDATHNFAGKLELAASVFLHSDTDMVYIGRDACHAWKMKEELEFSERGAEAVRSLLRELHVDPETTTTWMLEKLNGRFICEHCPVGLQRCHRTWRSCVSSRIPNCVNELDRISDYRFPILWAVRKQIILTLDGRR
jgi:hypothetical protein